MAVKLKGQNIKDTYQQLLHSPGGGLVYDGTGSLLPISFDGNDVIIPGALRAQSYIVSESIVNISSGSTAFGDSADDSHTFTGDITASANISASGNIYGTQIYAASALRFKDSGGTSRHVVTNGSDDLRVEIGNANMTSGVSLVGDVTASNHISASSNIIANKFYGDGELAKGFIAVDGTDTHLGVNTGWTVGTNITASGNISASGNIITSTLIGHGADTKFEVSGSISAYTGSFDIIEGGTF